MIQDGGNRREYETGAVRDDAEGKGRCDLMPLDVVAELSLEGGYGAVSTVIEGIYKWQLLLLILAICELL